MAVRGTPASRLQGNPLGGMLRDLNRRSRSTTRRRGSKPTAVEGPAGRQGARGPAGADGTVVAAAVVHTGEDGRAVFLLPEGGGFVVTAVAVSSEPVIVTLEDPAGGQVVLRAWRVTPGVVEPVGAGVAVHVTAVPAGC